MWPSILSADLALAAAGGSRPGSAAHAHVITLSQVNQRTLETAVDAVLYPLLIVDALVLALLELAYLPLRFDGRLLPALGDAPAPFSLLVAAITMPILVSQAAHWSARMGKSGLYAALPMIVWLVAVLVFGVMGPGGDRFMTQDWRMLALLALGTLPGSFVLGNALGKARAAQAARPLSGARTGTR